MTRESAEPTEVTQTTLKPAQQRRVLALRAAREVLVSAPFGSPGGSEELVRVADYIIEGEAK